MEKPLYLLKMPGQRDFYHNLSTESMIDRSKETEFHEVILPLYLLMQLSAKAYKKYMVNKIYLHALVIRSSNKKISEHILSKLSLIPEQLQDDVLQLLNHYDIWMTQFADFEKNKKPALTDPFIFYHVDDLSAFPASAEQKIFDYYNHLNNYIKRNKTNE